MYIGFGPMYTWEVSVKRIEGDLHQIAWGNRYTEPPAGAPRVLAEVFVVDRRVPAEFAAFRWTPGGGYSHFQGHITPPPKELSKETLAAVRRKRLARRVQAKTPLFAEQFIADELARRPEYYDGITDEKLQQAKDRALAEELELYLELIQRIGRVIIYAQEPPECQARAAALRAEFAAQAQLAAQRWAAAPEARP